MKMRFFKRCQKIAGKFGYETEQGALQLAIENLREIQKTKRGFHLGSRISNPGTILLPFHLASLFPRAIACAIVIRANR